MIRRLVVSVSRLMLGPQGFQAVLVRCENPPKSDDSVVERIVAVREGKGGPPAPDDVKSCELREPLGHALAMDQLPRR
jgi:hypothetical protein